VENEVVNGRHKKLYKIRSEYLNGRLSSISEENINTCLNRTESEGGFICLRIGMRSGSFRTSNGPPGFIIAA
jgi:hypothetical protein